MTFSIGSIVGVENIRCAACGKTSLDRGKICDSQNIISQYKLQYQSIACELHSLNPIESYQLMKCKSCGLEFSFPFKAPPPEWYDLLYKHLNLYPVDRWEYNFILERILPGTLICDLGCGSGQFLKYANGFGHKAIGFDFSASAVKTAEEQNLQVHHIKIDCIDKINSRECGTVVTFHVLEHLNSPSDLFRAVEALGNENCQIWISVPSDRRPSRVYSEIDILDLPPHHMTRWTPSALKELGVRNGWVMRNFFYEPISFKQKVWNATVRAKFYKIILARIVNHKWTERLLRIVFFVPICVAVLASPKKISGFSMLALFERDING